VIDTSKVTTCRELRFATIDELFRDAEMLVDADHAGKLTRLGNWTLGQALGHVASWADYAYEGYPAKPPWFVKVICRLTKQRFLNGPMPRGFRMPRVEAGTFAIDEMPAAEGLERVRRAFERLERTPPTAPNPAFGRLTAEEWLRMHLKHAALHLGFFKPE
jgi:hypothetical protein